MAKSSIIQNLAASAYSGKFSYAHEGLTVNGSVRADGNRKVSQLQGQVGSESEVVLSFSSYAQGDSLVFNFNNISNLDSVPAAVEAIKAAQAAVEEELSAKS